MLRSISTLVLLLSISTLALSAELRLHALFSDHMVLQRNQENPIWGWASPQAEITVEIADYRTHVVAGEDGHWAATLPVLPSSAAPLTMLVQTDTDTLIVSDILVGEVWLCSGQSNMRFPLRNVNNGDLEILTANYPAIRLMTVPPLGTQEPRENFNANWQTCTPKTVESFSAVGYLFGRQLHLALGVPIGLIDNAWGGSAAEAWVARDVLESDGRFDEYVNLWKVTEEGYDYDNILSDWKRQVVEAKEAGGKIPSKPQNELVGQHRPGNLWAGMIEPLIGYGIRGTIWYQGETNTSRAYLYDDLFQLMITEWREAWGQGDFPFYWVQLAAYKAERALPGESEWAELREAQSKTLILPNTGQAVIYDTGEGRNIHPKDKQIVATRLARIALARDYGFKLPYLSPRFDFMRINGSEVTLTFKNIGRRLDTFDVEEALGFTIAGEDQVWYPANARRSGKDKIIVFSPLVTVPLAVRYAWEDNPVANLRSQEGLPVIPFRTDDWPLSTLLKQ